MKKENEKDLGIENFDFYFEILPKWDKIDHIGKLAEYLKPKELSEGVDEMPRLKGIFKKLVVKMVACSVGKTLNRHCFVLMGANGIGKTSFLNWFLPPDLSCISCRQLELPKLTPEALITNFWVHIDELSSERKQDMAKLGDILLKDQVRVRLPYAERSILTPRRCNFVASTNSLYFLNDRVLQKRCIVFYLNEINWNYKTEIDINQVWAQAFELYKSNQFVYRLNQKDDTLNGMANLVYHCYFLEMQNKAMHK